MKTILVSYRTTSVGEKEFKVPDDFDIEDDSAILKLLADYGEVKLFNDSELDELDYEDVFEL
jgi:hypothetical protein